MKIFKPLLFVFALFMGTNLSAQNAHWSLYDYAPTFVNPATTGNFLGTLRVGGIYRDQARSALGAGAYSTPLVYVDAPILAIGKRDWIGVGATVWNDTAGKFDRGETGFLISAAYHHPLDKKSKNVISFGLQAGNVSQRINLTPSMEPGADNLDFASEINGGGAGSSNDRTRFGFEEGGNKGAFNMLNLGVTLKSKIDKLSDITIGLAAAGINTDNYSTSMSAVTLKNGFFGFGINEAIPNSGELVRPRITLNAQYNQTLKSNKRLSLSPSAIVNLYAGWSEIQAQAWMGYKIKDTSDRKAPDETDLKLLAGLGYRVGDAVQVLLGAEFNKLTRVAFSWDITTSQLRSATGVGGAFELGVSHTINVYKKPDVKPAILCPQM